MAVCEGLVDYWLVANVQWNGCESSRTRLEKPEESAGIVEIGLARKVF